MSDQFCNKETAVIRAARSGKWEPTLRTHLDSCAVCREAAKIVTAMSSLMLADADHLPPTPDPQRVWLKAAFAERQKRSVWIMRVSGVAYSALAASLLLALFWTLKQEQSSPGTALQTRIGLPIPSISPEVLLSVAAVTIIMLFLFVPSRRRSASPIA